MATTHTYSATCRWHGSTGLGYESYDRTHAAETVPRPCPCRSQRTLAFRGDPTVLNPEQLLLLAASSCQLLSFLAVAARAHVDVIHYEDHASAIMPEDDRPTRLTRIDLRPSITVAHTADTAKVLHLVDVAHRECFIANSLGTDIVITPTVTWGTGRGNR